MSSNMTGSRVKENAAQRRSPVRGRMARCSVDQPGSGSKAWGRDQAKMCCNRCGIGPSPSRPEDGSERLAAKQFLWLGQSTEQRTSCGM